MDNRLSRIHSSEIYQNFQPLPESIAGWGGDDQIFETLIDRSKPEIIVEVGTWMGQSAINMAEICRRKGSQCTIICVDTWLGSEEHILKDSKVLRPHHGYPTLYYQFLSNVIHRGVQNYIVPLPTTSLSACRVLDELSVRADLIYIDANHQYDAVLADLRAYASLLTREGIMFGHDYPWESVRRAVVSFCAEISRSHTVNGEFWTIER